MNKKLIVEILRLVAALETTEEAPLTATQRARLQVKVKGLRSRETRGAQRRSPQA